MSRNDSFNDLPPYGLLAAPLVTGLGAGLIALVMPSSMGSARIVAAALAALLVAAAVGLWALVRQARRGEPRPWPTALRLLSELFVAPRVMLLFVAAVAVMVATAPDLEGTVRTVGTLGGIMLGIAWAQTAAMRLRRS